MSDVFPAPVLPTTPTFCPASTSSVTPLSARGNSGRYLSVTSLNSNAPFVGHEVGGFLDSSVSAGASSLKSYESRHDIINCCRYSYIRFQHVVLTFAYWQTLSTELNLALSSALILMTKGMNVQTWNTLDRAKPREKIKGVN